MLNILLLVQICLAYQLSGQLIRFSKIWLYHFLVYGKISSSRKLRKSTVKNKNFCPWRIILRKMRPRPTDRQTDGQTNRIDFIGPFPQRWRFDHVLLKNSNITFSSIIWLDCKPYGKNQYNKKEYNTPFRSSRHHIVSGANWNSPIFNEICRGLFYHKNANMLHLVFFPVNENITM